MFNDGRYHHPSIQLPTGPILILPKHPGPSSPHVTLSACVSARSQEEDLDWQLHWLRVYVAHHKYFILKEVTEIGSGLKGRRTNLLRLLQDLQASTIVVEQNDHLARVGFALLAASLGATGHQIVVLLTHGLLISMINVHFYQKMFEKTFLLNLRMFK